MSFIKLSQESPKGASLVEVTQLVRENQPPIQWNPPIKSHDTDYISLGEMSSIGIETSSIGMLVAKASWLALLFDNLDVAERREAKVTGTSTHRRQNTGIQEEAKERVRGHEVYVFCEWEADRGIDAREAVALLPRGRTIAFDELVRVHALSTSTDFIVPPNYHGITIVSMRVPIQGVL